MDSSFRELIKLFVYTVNTLMIAIKMLYDVNKKDDHH